MKELCAFWRCKSYVLFVGLFVGFQWTSSGQSTLQDDAVVGVVRPLPSDLASSPLGILNERFRL